MRGEIPTKMTSPGRRRSLPGPDPTKVQGDYRQNPRHVCKESGSAVFHQLGYLWLWRESAWLTNVLATQHD
jgi:hypothetical protein